MKRMIEFIKRQLLFFLVIATIILCGIFVPRIVLSFRSNAKIIGRGSVDAAQIQPFGADTLLNERFLRSAVLFFSDHVYFSGYAADDPLLNPFDYMGVQPVAKGHVIWGRQPAEEEYAYPIPYEGFMLADTVMSEISTRFITSVRGDHPLLLLTDPQDNTKGYIVNTDSGVVEMDYNTGIPVMIDQLFVSSSRPDMDEFTAAVVSAYSNMTGISFTTEVDEEHYESVDGYDTSYMRAFRSYDDNFVLTITADSGWYWYRERGEWVASDQYLWDVIIVLNTN